MVRVRDYRLPDFRVGDGARTTDAKPAPRAPQRSATEPPPPPITFEYRPRHQRATKRQLIEDLRAVARRMRVRTLSMALYLRGGGRFSPRVVSYHLGGWNAALARAGMPPSRNFRVSAQQVIADLRRVARRLKTTRLSASDYERLGRYSVPMVYRRFGSWPSAMNAASLAPKVYRARGARDLFDNLQQVWRALGRQPRRTELAPPLSKFGAVAYERRFGNFTNALQSFCRWMASRPSDDGASREQRDIKPLRAPIRLHTTPRKPGWRLRYLVLERDGFRCQACGRSPANDPGVRLHADHITPWRRGGETTAANLQTLCQMCNGGKADLPGKKRRRRRQRRRTSL